MTLEQGPHGRDTPVWRILRSLFRRTAIIAVAMMAGFGPFTPPPPPPPLPRVEARAHEEDSGDDEDP